MSTTQLTRNVCLSVKVLLFYSVYSEGGKTGCIRLWGKKELQRLSMQRESGKEREGESKGKAKGGRREGGREKRGERERERE